MNIASVVKQIGVVFLLPISMLAPLSVSAEPIQSPIELTAFAEFSSQRVPLVTKSDDAIEPDQNTFTNAQVLLKVGNVPFPNVPTSQTEAFASSISTAAGVFGVGVSGFFMQNSLPPNAFVASGTFATTISNSDPEDTGVTLDFLIPAPTLRFFGVGNSFPVGADPNLDASAKAQLRLISTLTRADGSTQETVHLDYGLFTFRDPQTGVFFALPTSSDGVGLTRFDEFDGSFGFRLPDLNLREFSFGTFGPGVSLEVGYDYFATASTGFGETGVFAAIGDPFNLTADGGFNLELVGAAQPPDPGSGIPAPGSLALVMLGLTSLAFKQRQAVRVSA